MQLTQRRHGANRSAHDFSRNPMLVYCALSCKHCRAEAMPFPQLGELTYGQSKEFLQQITEFGDPLPHLILTGGDPLSRADLYELIDYACTLGLEVSITPSATPALTEDALNKLKMHGIQSLGLSIDGSNADNGPLRVIPGSHVNGVLTDASVMEYVSAHKQIECLSPRGGVVAMRPLLIHSSSKARGVEPRRVLHIEYADSLDIGGMHLAVV